MAVKSYKDLLVWQTAMDLCVSIYKLSESFPNRENFGLCSQVQRAATSVPSNIAEGQGRGPGADFRRFLLIAKGSLQEAETQLLLALRLGYITQTQLNPIEIQFESVKKLLNATISSLEKLV